MRGGHHEVARAYVLYRERRTQERAHQQHDRQPVPSTPVLHVIDNGQRVPLDEARLRGLIDSACANLGQDVHAAPIVAETLRNLYDGVPMDEVYKASILAARTLIEKDPDYTYATARLLLHTIVREVLGQDVVPADMGPAYAAYFPQFIQKGVDNELLDPRLLQYDLARLGAALDAGRDQQFDYLGLQTLYDRYFLHVRKTRIEPAPVLLHARGHGPGAERARPRSPCHRVLRSAVVVRLHVEHAHALQQRHAALATLVLLPDHGARRPRRHLRIHQGKRPALQVRGRPGQRLDPRACARLAHQGHERRIAGRGAVPQGGERHGRGREPGRQAQGRRLHLPGNLAPRH